MLNYLLYLNLTITNNLKLKTNLNYLVILKNTHYFYYHILSLLTSYYFLLLLILYCQSSLYIYHYMKTSIMAITLSYIS